MPTNDSKYIEKPLFPSILAHRQRCPMFQNPVFSSSLHHSGPVILPMTDSSFLSSIEDRMSSADIRCLLYEIRNKLSLGPADGNAVSRRFFENMIDFLE